MAVARVRGIYFRCRHLGAPRRRRGGSRFLVATGAGSRSHVTSAAEACAAMASTGEACFLGQPSLWGQNDLRGARGAARFCGGLCGQNIGSLVNFLRLRGCSAAFYTTQSLTLDRPPPAGICLADSCQQSSCGTERPGEQAGNENGALVFSSAVSSVLHSTLAKLSSSFGPDKAANA